VTDRARGANPVANFDEDFSKAFLHSVSALVSKKFEELEIALRHLSIAQQ